MFTYNRQTSRYKSPGDSEGGTVHHGPLTRYIKLRVAHAPEMPGTFSPPLTSKKTAIVSDPGMHHGTCVTHVPWCMLGALTRGGGENVPGIPVACPGAHAQPTILRICEEAHWKLKEKFEVLWFHYYPVSHALLVRPNNIPRVELEYGPHANKHPWLACVCLGF